METISQLAAEVFYGQRVSVAWRMIGYDPAPKRTPGVDPVHVEPSGGRFDRMADSYDAIVIGAGAGGGVAAALLAEAGATVLLVERGRFHSYAEIGQDHERDHRLALYGFNTAVDLDAGPRVYIGADGRTIVADAMHHPSWYANAMTVGGGTRVYQGMAWRFYPDDFMLASRYGVPEASSVADWPIRYDELEPYYARAEWELGVCGDGAAHRVQGPRSRPYPMESLPWNSEVEILRRGAEKLAGPRGRCRC